MNDGQLKPRNNYCARFESPEGLALWPESDLALTLRRSLKPHRLLGQYSEPEASPLLILSPA